MNLKQFFSVFLYFSVVLLLQSCGVAEPAYEFVSLPAPIGTDIFRGNTYDCTSGYFLEQYVFHTDNTVDYYKYSITGNEKTLSSQIHYAYSYNANTQLLYLFSLDNRMVSGIYIGDNQVLRDIARRRSQTLISIYFCTKSDTGVLLTSYFAGKINETQIGFQYNDSDISLYFLSSYIYGQGRNKNTNQSSFFRGVPTFADDGTLTIHEYKNRTISIERNEDGTWGAGYPIYTKNVIKGVYSFSAAGTEVTGTITFTEIPEDVEINWGIEANTPYTVSQVETTSLLIKQGE